VFNSPSYLAIQLHSDRPKCE